jgi:hypothetical protein
MPDLLIRIKKKTDGAAALSCIRADGTTTWQRQEGQLGGFFPLHDLTHYAVESVLRLHRAFYGLLAEGWDITDFGKAGTKDRLTDEAMFAELVVGYFDIERATDVQANANEYHEKIDAFYRDRKLSPTSLRVSDQQLNRIRQRRAELFARWHALPPGDALELTFNHGVESAV